MYHRDQRLSSQGRGTDRGWQEGLSAGLLSLSEAGRLSEEVKGGPSREVPQGQGPLSLTWGLP